MSSGSLKIADRRCELARIASVKCLRRGQNRRSHPIDRNGVGMALPDLLAKILADCPPYQLFAANRLGSAQQHLHGNSMVLPTELAQLAEGMEIADSVRLSRLTLEPLDRIV